jgi:hypothetical protein
MNLVDSELSCKWRLGTTDLPLPCSRNPNRRVFVLYLTSPPSSSFVSRVSETEQSRTRWAIRNARSQGAQIQQQR